MIYCRSNKAGDEADEHAPAGLNEVILCVVIRFVHMLRAGEANRTHIIISL